jgi:hypothetical protein
MSMGRSPESATQPHGGVGPDPGAISVKVSGVWFGGRLRSQVSFSRLNHGPSADDLTEDSVTATGYFANVPSAQLGTHWFSQSVPCPAAVKSVQFAQVSLFIRMPASAHVSTIDDGFLLSACGSALAQSATTPTSATAAAVCGALAGETVVPAGEAGAAVAFAVAAEPAEAGAVVGEPADVGAVVAEATADRAGDAAWTAGDAAWTIGEAAAVGVTSDAAAEPPWPAWHPAMAAPSAVQRASFPNVGLMLFKTHSMRGGCIA